MADILLTTTTSATATTSQYSDHQAQIRNDYLLAVQQRHQMVGYGNNITRLRHGKEPTTDTHKTVTDTPFRD